jgi:hypothetical protein
MKKVITIKDSNENPFVITISTDRGYFAITAEGKDRGGCMHDEILRYRPDLKPFVDLHLAWLDGEPLHAEANGWHWLAKVAEIKQRYEPEQTQIQCLQLFREHVRLPHGLSIVDAIRHEYRKGRETVATSENVSARCEQEQRKVGAESARKLWGSICEGMKERWAREAQDALILLEKIA